MPVVGLRLNPSQLCSYTASNTTTAFMVLGQQMQKLQLRSKNRALEAGVASVKNGTSMTPRDCD
jgi:hypothetical protein